jgi:hypothetical protein
MSLLFCTSTEPPRWLRLWSVRWFQAFAQGAQLGDKGRKLRGGVVAGQALLYREPELEQAPDGDVAVREVVFLESGVNVSHDEER